MGVWGFGASMDTVPQTGESNGEENPNKNGIWYYTIVSGFHLGAGAPISGSTGMYVRVTLGYCRDVKGILGICGC